MVKRFYSAEVIELDNLINEIIFQLKSSDVVKYNSCIDKLNILLKQIDLDVARGYDDGK